MCLVVGSHQCVVRNRMDTRCTEVAESAVEKLTRRYLLVYEYRSQNSIGSTLVLVMLIVGTGKLVLGTLTVSLIIISPSLQVSSLFPLQWVLSPTSVSSRNRVTEEGCLKARRGTAGD